MIRCREWFTREQRAEALARRQERGGILSAYLTIPERPPEHRHQPWHLDWLEPGPGTPGVEWVPPHLSDAPTPPGGS